MRRLLGSLLVLGLFVSACQDSIQAPDNLPEGDFVLMWEHAVSRVKLGERIQLSLWLRASRDVECDAPDVVASVGAIEGGKLTAQTPGRWLETDEYRYWTRDFELVWLRLDERSLPAVEHKGKKGDETLVAKTEILDFDVLGSLGAKPADEAEVPADLIVDAPGPPLWPWLLGFFALLLIVGTGLLFLKKSKSSMRPIGVPAILPADQEALRRIKDLQRQLEAGEIGGEELVVAVSDILRAWLQNGLGLSSLARTSEEFLADMREGQLLPLDLQRPLTVFIGQCDLVKFAAQGANYELCASLLGIARDFVMSTKASSREAAETRQAELVHG